MRGRALAETAGMEGGIAFVVVTVKQHEAELIGSTDTQRMDGRQSTVAIDCRFANEGDVGRGQAVVEGSIEEGRAGGGVEAVVKLRRCRSIR